MLLRRSLLIFSILAGLTAPTLVSAAVEVGRGDAVSLPYLQCVPYARQISGIRIFGDAHTWWDQAEGHYARGHVPQVGAVIAFRPSRNMRLGHVAAVSRIIDSRTVLVRHANWSLINGRRGQIENDVRAVDVSSDNDWSEVRVWYAPIQSLGTTHWPVRGFIYNRTPGTEPRLLPATQLARRDAPERREASARRAVPALAPVSSDDPIGEIIARSRRIASTR